MKRTPGKSSRLSLEQQNELKHVIVTQVPTDVGFTTKFNWTLQIIAEFIRRSYVFIFLTWPFETDGAHGHELYQAVLYAYCG